MTIARSYPFFGETKYQNFIIYYKLDQNIKRWHIYSKWVWIGWLRFSSFFIDRIESWEVSQCLLLEHVIFVAYNSCRFDILFLCNAMDQHKMSEWCNSLRNKDYFNLIIPKLGRYFIIQAKLNLTKNFKLTTLYKHFIGKDLENAHRADLDVLSTISMLKYPEIWWQQFEIVAL